jgi:serine/threonine protein kinase
MKLYKSENALKGRGINKFSLKCEEDKDKYLNLVNILYKSINENAVIIKGLYDNKKDIVLKIGILPAINKEYDIASKLKEIPNFIRYYCKFLCEDDIKEIINNENMLNAYNLGKNGKNTLGILTMGYYKLASIGNFIWKSGELNVLKNVLKQSVFAICYAYKMEGFVHGDLHADNILLKEKNICEIDYCYKKLLVNTFEIRIMDFEKSRLNKDLEFKFVLDNIEKLLNSVVINDRHVVKFNYKNEMLRKMKNKIIIENINGFSINQTHFDNLELIVDSFYIEYTK